MSSVQSFKLDITPSGRPASIKCTASQYDAGREIAVSLVDGSSAYTIPDGATVTLSEYKPDGNIIVADCEWDGSDVVIVLTEQMSAIAGKCLCELQITYDDIVIGTENFILSVEKSPIADGVESESVITSLESYVTAAKAAAESAAESAEAAAESASGGTGSSVTITLASLIPDGAGPHNSIYRGEYLGDALTEDQLDAIEAGTFEDLFPGDYWLIDGVRYRIMGFGLFNGSDDYAISVGHAVILPDACLLTKCYYGSDSMLGYAGNEVFTEYLPTAQETVETAFGADYVLTHSENLITAISTSSITLAWTESKLNLPSERMIYGSGRIGSASYGSTIYINTGSDLSQFPAMAHNPALIRTGEAYWLRDIIAVTRSGKVDAYGNPGYNPINTNNTSGIRPYFCIGRE